MPPRYRKKPTSEKELAKKVLMWLAYTKRPMRLGELSQAVAIEPDMESPEDFEEAIVNDLGALASVCANLVIIDVEYLYANSTVRFVHYTVQEFLVPKSPGIGKLGSLSSILQPDAQLAHEEISRVCIKYLLIMYSGEDLELWDSFNSYASKSWHYHIRMLKKLDEGLWELLYNFISSGTLFYKTIPEFRLSASSEKTPKNSPPLPSQ